MIRRAILAHGLILLASMAVFADEPALEFKELALPEEVPAAISEALGTQAAVISLGDAVVANFWLEDELKAAETASTELGVTFGAVEAGSFVGVVQIVGEWSDYKENPIAPGTYSLRYGVMPADGNHMGVATYRDFLLLVSLEADTDPAKALDLGDLLAGSLQVTGVPHPAVLALFPIWDEVTEPTLVKNDVGQWTLAVKVGSHTLGLVIAGHGEI